MGAKAVWKWIRIPKAVALLAFLLPWMTVSCSSTRFASATGVGLAFGHIDTELPVGRGAHGPGMNLVLVLAIVGILVGLVLAFRAGTRANARNVAIASGAGLLLIFAGTARYSKSAILAEAARKNPMGGSLDQAVFAAIRIDWQFGFWLAVVALAIALIMALLVFTGHDRTPSG